MTQSPKGLFDEHSATQEFLLNKAILRLRDDRFGDISEETLTILSHQFPEIYFGPYFIEKAITVLDNTPSFSAMVIQLDDDELAKRDTDVSLRTKILHLIADFCRETSGFWGVMGEDIFGAFFPNNTDTACLLLSQKLQDRLSSTGSETVTIGVAAYPTLDYSRGQVFDNACKALDHARFFGPNSAVAFDSVSLNISGDTYYQAGDIEGAISEYRLALQLDPENVNVHNSLGVCHGVLNDFENALTSFQTAFELDENEIMAVYNTGFVYMLKEELDKALAYFKNAYQMEQDVFEVVFQLGRCHLELKENDHAVKFLEKAIQIRPDSAPAASCLGQSYVAMEMTDQAIQSFQTAIKKNPNDAEALSGLGYLFDIQDENVEIATMFCKQSVDISPENGLYHHRLARLYLKQNMLNDAMNAFQTASDLGYDSSSYIEDIEKRLDNSSSC